LPEIRNWKWGATSAGKPAGNHTAEDHQAVPELNRIKNLKNAGAHK